MIKVTYMEHFLQVSINGQIKRLSLSSDEFNSIREAKDKLSDLMKFTENYSVLVESYRRVEISKFEVELDHILFNMLDYIDHANARIILNSPISGYLSCARFFLDSTNSISQRLLPKIEYELYVELRKSIYDSNLEYRFVEALRNYVQHNELPISAVMFHNFREHGKSFEEAQLVTCISLLANKEKLGIGNSFKKKVLEELPEKIDIIHSIRTHMSGLWEIQNYLNGNLNSLSEKYRLILETYIDKFQNSTGEKSPALYACEVNSDGTVIQKIPVTVVWDKAREQLSTKLGNLKNLAQRYITGQIQK